MILKQSSWAIKPGKSYPKLTEHIETDVVIAGAGIAGIFSAYILSSVGIKVVVLKKNKDILQNATMFTTAFITKVIDTSFTELVKLYGQDQAKLIWKSGEDAINLIADIVKKENIDCEFKFVPSFTYAKDEAQFIELAREYQTVKKAGFEANLSKDSSKLNFKNAGFMEIQNQAMFHPIKFAMSLAEKAELAGVKIFTNSEVLVMEDSTLKTEAGQVKAKDIVIATYAPTTNDGTRFKKGMYISYVYELEITKGLIAEGMYFDMSNPYHYFRIDSFTNFDRMIVGGEDHRQELKINPDKNFNALLKYIETVLDNSPYKINRGWSGQILESSDGLGLIGEIKPHTFVITGFSGNGMTYSAISSMIMRDLIKKNKNPYINLYDPKRTPTIKQLSRKGLDYIEEFFGGALKNFFVLKK